MKCVINFFKTVVFIGWLVVSLTLFLPAISKAEIEGTQCNPEPTDMNIAYGDLITCNIDPVGDSDTFRFFGTEDEVIVIMAASGFRYCIDLIAPDNSRQTACKSTSRQSIDTTLDQTGTFTILLRDYYGSGSGEYALTLQCLNPPCGDDGPDDVFCNGRKATIVGTEGNDILTGTDGPDVIHGLGGVDIIRGMGGNDTICGGDAADFLSGVDGNDIIFGEHGDDAIWGGPGDDIIDGGDGHDSIKGGYGNDELNGGDGHDVLNGLAGDDILNGNYGNDTLYGGDGVDELVGGWGPNNGTIDNNDSCYDVAGTDIRGCEVFYEQ